MSSKDLYDNADEQVTTLIQRGVEVVNLTGRTIIYCEPTPNGYKRAHVFISTGVKTELVLHLAKSMTDDLVFHRTEDPNLDSVAGDEVRASVVQVKNFKLTGLPVAEEPLRKIYLIEPELLAWLHSQGEAGFRRDVLAPSPYPRGLDQRGVLHSLHSDGSR